MGMNRATAIATASRLALSLWWGGLTFYAGFVVPIGSDITDKTTQGFVTQRVTVWLNVLAIVVCVLAWCDGVRKRTWPVIVAWGALVASIPLIFWCHWSLTGMLDAEAFAVLVDEKVFYRQHQLYLWLTVLQWLSGILLLSPIGPQDSPDAGSS